MALVLEDGTGTVTGANAYIAAADCDAYHSDRNRSAWTGTEAVKQAAIIRATDYLDATYTWFGEALTGTQPLEWPRTTATGLPKQLVAATAELALLALTGELAPAQEGQRLQSESVSVGGAVTRSRSFAGGGGFANDRRFPFIDKMLSRYGTGGSASVRSAPIERA